MYISKKIASLKRQQKTWDEKWDMRQSQLLLLLREQELGRIQIDVRIQDHLNWLKKTNGGNE